MKPLRMTSLHTAIVIALVSMTANAQTEDKKPAKPAGLYVTVSQSEVYIIQGDSQLDLKVGEAAFAGTDALSKLDAIPALLNWPCGGSSGEQAAEMVPTYSLDSLPPGNKLEEIVRRFFEGPEIPTPAPAWLNGESHGKFSANEIDKFASNAYWYLPGKTTAKMEALRPEVLLISLYPATQQVIVDQNHYQELRDLYGDEEIPVTFVFNEGTVVPISALGKNAGLQEVADLYFEKGITVAEVPMWYGGDRQIETSPEELEQLFKIPSIEEIDPARFAALVEDLQTNGFTKKPINVALMAQNSAMVVDEGEKVRAAQSIGMDSIPIVFFTYSADSASKRCGLTMPQIAVGGGIGEGGSSPGTSPPGAGPPNVGVPPFETVPPNEPETPASDS
jgi:hypothetical protein